MSDEVQATIETDRATIAPPRRSHCVMALADVALLIGPRLGVLWPR